MSTEIALPSSFGQAASVFQGMTVKNDDLSAGVAASYGIIGFKGKVWSNRYGGEEKVLMREDGDGPRNSIDVVLVKGAPAISKIFYKGGYVDGANAPPDCWSGNGITPDASVVAKVNPTCADCPMNAWGSRVSEAGKPGRACSDSRRLAVVPVGDMKNELFNGPMLLRIPAASLKDLKGYSDLLSSHQFPYFAVATKISFDVNEAYPKFVFQAIRPLTAEEGAMVLELQNDPRTKAVLNETAATVGAGAPVAQAAEVPKSPFLTDEVKAELAKIEVAPKVTENTKVAEAVKAVTPEVKAVVVPAGPTEKEKRIAAARAAAAAAAAEAARLAAELEEDSDEAPPGADEDDEGAPVSFDTMLEGLLPSK